MKFLKKSVEVEAVLFTEDHTPEGVLFEGYDPATEGYKQAYIETPVGNLPIKHGDYVIYENSKTYPCTPEAMAQNFTEPPETEDKSDGQAFALIDKQEIGTKNYFLNEAGRVRCLCCDKKGSGFLLLRNNMNPKRLFMCEECFAKYILAVEGNGNGK